MKLINLDSMREPLAIVIYDRYKEYYGPVIEEIVESGQLLMLCWSGVYWLIPHEVAKECAVALKQHRKNKEAYNTMPPVTINIQQCIPIPSETAKILLEL